MADTRSVDLKLKRLRAIEADYRSAIKRAEDEYDRNFIAREKMLKIKKKYEAKIEKLLPKIRKYMQLRKRMKGRG